MGQLGATKNLTTLLNERLPENTELLEEYIIEICTTRYSWKRVQTVIELDIGDEEFRRIPNENLDLLANAIMEEVTRKFAGIPESEVPALNV